MEGDGDVGFFAEEAKPVQVGFFHRVFKVGYRAEGFEFFCETRGGGRKVEEGVGVHAYGVVGAGAFFHSPDGFDNVPGAGFEFVTGEAFFSAYCGFCGGFVGFHVTGPVGDGYTVADLLAKEAVDRNAVGLSGNVQEGGGEDVPLGKGVQGERVFPNECGGFLFELGGLALAFSNAFQAFIRLDAADGDVVDLGHVFGNRWNGGDFDFVEIDGSDFHFMAPCEVERRGWYGSFT